MGYARRVSPSASGADFFRACRGHPTWIRCAGCGTYCLRVDLKATPREKLFAVALLWLTAMPLFAYLWGFGVDDAFITARYAYHLASGQGYSFNPGAAASDGVTPLGFAHALALLRPHSVLQALRYARGLGLLAWLVQLAAVGLSVQALEGSKRRWFSLLLVATSAPCAAWAGAGMETAVVAAWVALALLARWGSRENQALVWMALAVAWRPELALFASVFALASPGKEPPTPGSRLLKLLVVASPALSVAMLRWWFFGRLLPLALLAKPPSVRHGLLYAAAVFLLCGGPAVVAWREVSPRLRSLQLALLAHGLALVLAGGDWMPLSRLVVPVLPALWLCCAGLLARSCGRLRAAALFASLLGQIFVCQRVGPRARTVMPRTLKRIAELSPALRGSRVVAALDVGWLGAATPQTVVDLAGVTDVHVAVLAGGHTSKRINPNLLRSRNVDTLVLLLGKKRSLEKPWYRSAFARVVELRLARMAEVQKHFVVVSRAQSTIAPYLVLQRRHGTKED